jgi:hypothetical protein
MIRREISSSILHGLQGERKLDGYLRVLAKVLLSVINAQVRADGLSERGPPRSAPCTSSIYFFGKLESLATPLGASSPSTRNMLIALRCC